MNTLRQVKVGQTCIVKRVHGEGALRRRIMDMGITKGVEIYVRKVARLIRPLPSFAEIPQMLPVFQVMKIVKTSWVVPTE